MSTPKGHHFVPEVLLKRFVDAEGWLHFARREGPGRIRPTRINKAFKKSHLYSQLSSTGEKDPEVEFELSKLEGEVDDILNKVISCARADEVPVLTEAQLNIWYRFFIAQWRRVPDLQKQVTPDEMAHGMLSEIHDDLRARFPERTQELALLATPDEMARTIRNARVRSVLEASPEIMELFRARGIRVVRHRLPRKSFVISSRPVVQMNFKPGHTLFHLQTEMWLPVSSDVIIGVGGGGPIELLHFDREEPVRLLNQAAVRHSSAFGCRSAVLASSLASASWPQWSV